jgi:hypothetical protein
VITELPPITDQAGIRPELLPVSLFDLIQSIFEDFIRTLARPLDAIALICHSQQAAGWWLLRTNVFLAFHRADI